MKLRIECDSKSGRPFYRFYGVAYNQLVHGQSSTSKVQADMTDPDSYYYDEAIRLSTHDLKHFGKDSATKICGNLAGKPICVEHDQDVKVGEVTYQWVDDDGEVRVTGRIYTDTSDGRHMAQQVSQGDFRGLSVGYNAETYDAFDGSTTVTYKEFDELSLCREPFFKGCGISIAASSKGKGKKKSQESNAQTYKSKTQKPILNRIRIKNMEPEQQQQNTETPAAAAPSTPVEDKGEAKPMDTSADAPADGKEEKSNDEKEKAELLKGMDGLASDAKELANNFLAEQKKVADLESEKEALKTQNEALMAKFAADQQPLLQSTLGVYKEAHKKYHNEELPENFSQDLAGTLLNPSPENQLYAQAITATAKMSNDLKSENTMLLEKLAAMENQMKELSKVQEAAALQLNASRASITKVAAAATKDVTGMSNKGKEEEEDLSNALALDAAANHRVDVNASANNELIYGPKPGKADIPFMQQARRSHMIGVNASANGGRVGYRKAPVHAHMYTKKGELSNPNSARYSKNPAHRALFSMLCSRQPLTNFVHLKGDDQDLTREPLVGAQ